MTTIPSPLLKHYLRIFSHWPTDALRSVSVPSSLRARLSQRLASPSLQKPLIPPPPPQSNWVNPKADIIGNVPPPIGGLGIPTINTTAKVEGVSSNSSDYGYGIPELASPISIPGGSEVGRAEGTTAEVKELRNIKALYSLLENRYANLYPTSEAMLRPNFNPEYYSALAREIEEAPKRTWWQRKWLRWSRLVRLS